MPTELTGFGNPLIASNEAAATIPLIRNTGEPLLVQVSTQALLTFVRAMHPILEAIEQRRLGGSSEAHKGWAHVAANATDMVNVYSTSDQRRVVVMFEKGKPAQIAFALSLNKAAQTAQRIQAEVEKCNRNLKGAKH